MQRHLLNPVGTLSVPQVVSRLCGVQTASSAELAIRVRRKTSRRGGVPRALTDGRQRYFGVTPKQLDLLRETVRGALDGAVLTRDDLVTAVTAPDGLDHAGDALRSGWGTLLKPRSCWRG